MEVLGSKKQRRLFMNVFHAVQIIEVDPLKPERVQEPLADEAEVRLKAAEWMQKAPTWQVATGGKAVEKVQKLPSTTAALAHSSFVTSLASSLQMPVGVRLVGPQVYLTIEGQKVQGRRAFLSEGQIAFAAMLT
jgi:hypothetical protein